MSISCVIVNYNNAPYLEQAVSSVLGQTQPPDEIIIADDASTDRSAEVIHAIQHQHPFIRTIIRDTNLGVTANRDLAIRDVSTDFFTTLDSDDIFFPKKVEQEALVLNSNPNAIAFSDIHIIDARNNILDTIETKIFETLSISERVYFLVARRRGMPRDMMMSKKTYLQSGGFVHGLSRYEDWDLNIRLGDSVSDWLYSGAIGTGYRRTGHGLSSGNQISHTIDKMKVLSRYRHIKHKRAFFMGMCELFVIKGFRKTRNILRGRGDDII